MGIVHIGPALDLVILGAGGHGKVVLEVIEANGRFRPLAFLDDRPTAKRCCGQPVRPTDALDTFRKRGVRHAFVAVGDCSARLRLGAKLLSAGFQLPSVVHPTAYVAPRAEIGDGTIVCPGAHVITDARIGDLCIINTGASVDHECELEDGVHVAPLAALAGRVTVGRGTFIGMGSRVIECLRIGAGVTVGAGAVVIRDLNEGDTVVGVPARTIKDSTPLHAAFPVHGGEH